MAKFGQRAKIKRIGSHLKGLSIYTPARPQQASTVVLAGTAAVYACQKQTRFNTRLAPPYLHRLVQSQHKRFLIFDNVSERSVGHDASPPPYGRMKSARDATAIVAVAAQPQIVIDCDSVSRPMTLGFRTINIITAISGAASTPLTTAAQ